MAKKSHALKSKIKNLIVDGSTPILTNVSEISLCISVFESYNKLKCVFKCLEEKDTYTCKKNMC